MIWVPVLMLIGALMTPREEDSCVNAAPWKLCLGGRLVVFWSTEEGSLDRSITGGSGLQRLSPIEWAKVKTDIETWEGFFQNPEERDWVSGEPGQEPLCLSLPGTLGRLIPTPAAHAYTSTESLVFHWTMCLSSRLSIIFSFLKIELPAVIFKFIFSC